MQPQGYEISAKGSGSLVERFFQDKGSNVAMVGPHFTMSVKDVALLNVSCEKLFYVTGTRTMRERLLSVLKIKHSHKYPVPVITTLNDSVWERALRETIAVSNETHGKVEREYEAYPFQGEASMHPDYIIRHTHITSDLRKLLDAFGCAKLPIKVLNTHTHVPDANSTESTDRDDRPSISDIPLFLGDAKHLRLMRIAEEENESGLKKARIFQERELEKVVKLAWACHMRMRRA